MAYPRRLLDEDEQVVDERGLHVLKVLPAIFRALLVFAGLGAGFFLWKNAPIGFGIFIGVVFVLTLSYLFINLMSFRSTQLVVTSKRLIYHSGVVRRRTREVAFASLVSVKLEQRFTERLIGLGSVRVLVNGEGEPLVFQDISRPKEFVAQLQGAKEREEQLKIRGALKTTGDLDTKEETESGGTVDVDSEHRRLLSLYDRGIITKIELAEQMSSLGYFSATGESADTDRPGPID
jgi:uncharacterized membrane protein YdbT with pleckstrin-like domain